MVTPSMYKQQLLTGGVWQMKSCTLGAAIILLALSFPPINCSTFAQEALTKDKANDTYLGLICRHFDRIIDVGTDRYGDDKSPLWLASIDLIHGGQNENVQMESRRVYRSIHAPRGSNLYWDLPLIVAAYRASVLAGEPKYQAGADAYIDAFLQRCVSKQNGLFMWGNHLWYHVEKDQIEFIDHSSHEARPLAIPWNIFWGHSQTVTEKFIRSVGKFHTIDSETGFFDRHATTEISKPRPENRHKDDFYPFIESGGLIVESLCWLASKNPSDREALIYDAKQIARFCAEQRGKKTGILRNQANPLLSRWDYHNGTTEVGLWATSLLRAAALTGDKQFVELCQPGLLAYLKYGWDAETGKYYGAVGVEDGAPQQPWQVDSNGYRISAKSVQEDESKGDTARQISYPYMPTLHSDIWEPLFPIHDYPMSLGEACLSFYELTGRDEYRQGAERMVQHINNSLPARYLSQRNGQYWIDGAYAANYGSCIRFLLRASVVLKETKYRTLAEELAADAIDRLYLADVGAFRSHPGENTADSVDGLGVLFLALMELETGEEGDLCGFHF